MSRADITYNSTEVTSEEPVTVKNIPLSTVAANKVPAVPADCIVLRFTDYIPWNNPYDMISFETEQALQTFLTAAVVPALFLICCPTNIINMAVFYKQGLRERINFCLFTQSALDLILILYVFAINSDSIYLRIKKMSKYSLVSKVFFENNLVGLYGFAWASEFMTMVIACERCFCVVNPLRSQTVLKTKTTVAFVLPLAGVIVGVFFVVGARWTVRCVFDPSINATTLTAFPSGFYLNHRELVDVLESVIYGYVLPGVTMTVVAVTTTLTNFKLRKMAEWRQKTSSAAAGQLIRDVTLTRMLIGTAVLFLVCNIPGIIARTVILFVPDLSLAGRYRNSYNVILLFNQLAWYFNSSVHFFIYLSLGSKFRETLKEVFCRRTSKSPV